MKQELRLKNLALHIDTSFLMLNSFVFSITELIPEPATKAQSTVTTLT